MSLSDKIKSVRGLAGRPFTYVTAEWGRMAPRERRWVTALAVCVAGMAVLLVTYFVASTIGELEDSNADTRDALVAIAKHRDEYLEAKARGKADEARVGNAQPQIMADLEAAARELSVQIPESTERPAVAAGRRYMQHDVDLKLRQVDLQTLSKFLQKVETGAHLIVFTRMSVKRRYSEQDKLDVDLTATAFSRVDEKSKKKEQDKAGKSSSTEAGKESAE